MNEDETNLWLKKLFDASHFDIWLATSYMYRYPSIGIQQYICNRIKYYRPPIHLLPQLVHIFLYYNDTIVSRPIYSLFKFWANRSQKFSCALYFHLKSVLQSISDSKSAFCYFLICDLFEIDRKRTSRNVKVLELQYKYKVRLGRTIGLPALKQGSPLFKGLFLFFVRAVSWMVHPRLFKKIGEYERIFLRSTNVYGINFKADFGSGNAFSGCNMRANISFLESLVEISGRLKKLPRHLRQRGLEMEIRLLNYNLPARVSLPFHSNKFVLAARVEESFPLDSAENSPFVIVFETANKAGGRRGHVAEELKNASFLMQQLNAISGLSSLGEIDIIKENVMDSIEKILMTERYEDMPATDSIGIENNLVASGCSISSSEVEKNGSSVEEEMSKLSISSQCDGKEDVDEELMDVSLEEAKKIESLEKEDEVRNVCEKKNVGKHLDDASVGRRVSKQHGDHEIFLMADRSYSAGQLTQGPDVEENVTDETLTSTRESLDGMSRASGYRHHDSWMLKKAELKRTSSFKNLEGWSAESVIVKTGNSLKQELIAYQILVEMREIWKEENKPIWVHGYQIYLVNSTSGIIETVIDAMSIHKIKKRMMSENKSYFLKNHFVESFGLNTTKYKKSLKNFLYSLVGYSLATYILQIKDRHNGNIMIDGQGHIVHVDFGFIMGLHPGFYCVEAAPFKFSKEYFDLLEDLIDEFKVLFLEGYMALRKHSERLCRTIEMISEGSEVECLNKKELGNFRDRLKLELSDKEVEEYVLYLINKSFNSMGTGLYDSYQYFSYGYL